MMLLSIVGSPPSRFGLLPSCEEGSPAKQDAGLNYFYIAKKKARHLRACSSHRCRSTNVDVIDIDSRTMDDGTRPTNVSVIKAQEMKGCPTIVGVTGAHKVVRAS